MTKTNRNAGFTLIEMLVVITIIALLATLMSPALSSMFERSKLTTCSNRKRSVYQALILYGVEHNGYLPSPSGPKSGRERRFAYFANPYLDADWTNRYSIPPQYKCPMIKEYPWLNTHTIGFNYNMGGLNIRAQGSTKTMMLADTRSSFYLFSNRWNDYLHYRHKDPTRKGVGVVSFIYGDGHTATLPYGSPKIIKPHEKCPLFTPDRRT